MRRYDRGDTFFNCLLVLVLGMGTAIWAWMTFGAHSEIMNGGKPESIVTVSDDNREATLQYQRRMRERYFGTSEHAVAQARELVARVRAGKYKGDQAAFEQRYTEVVRGLEDNLGELNANQVPLRFAEGHLKLGLAHRHAYEALKVVDLAIHEEPKLQKSHLREATEDAAKAEREVRQGRQMLQPNFR